MTTDRPTYEELLDLLRTAPARHAIADDRYWAWWARVEAVLRRCA